jgi:hypothetical protein
VIPTLFLKRLAPLLNTNTGFKLSKGKLSEILSVTELGVIIEDKVLMFKKSKDTISALLFSAGSAIL